MEYAREIGKATLLLGCVAGAAGSPVHAQSASSMAVDSSSPMDRRSAASAHRRRIVGPKILVV